MKKECKTLRQSNLYLIGILERITIGNGGKSIYKEMINKNFSTLLKKRLLRRIKDKRQ